MLILQVCIWRHNGTVDHSTTDLELTVAFDTCRCEVVSDPFVAKRPLQ